MRNQSVDNPFQGNDIFWGVMVKRMAQIVQLCWELANAILSVVYGIDIEPHSSIANAARSIGGAFFFLGYL